MHLNERNPLNMINPVKLGTSECFVITSGHIGLPGCYATRRAANYAFQFPNGELQKLQDKVNASEPDENKRVITFEMLQELAKHLKEQRARCS